MARQRASWALLLFLLLLLLLSVPPLCSFLRDPFPLNTPRKPTPNPLVSLLAPTFTRLPRPCRRTITRFLECPRVPPRRRSRTPFVTWLVNTIPTKSQIQSKRKMPPNALPRSLVPMRSWAMRKRDRCTISTALTPSQAMEEEVETPSRVACLTSKRSSDHSTAEEAVAAAVLAASKRSSPRLWAVKMETIVQLMCRSPTRSILSSL
mmetsp:Transcript_37922/g.62936  ORF Transcript_37922/g.62936 Transcript_37922/m.62936 type:complete len:207 (-) Transcript_37922:704-1324(-)